MISPQQYEKELEEKSRYIQELQAELDATSHGMTLLAMEFEQSQDELAREYTATVQQLQAKSSQLQEAICSLQTELEETNRGILLITMEYDEERQGLADKKNVEVEQLQKELEVTNQGFIALTLELEHAKERFRNIIDYADGAIFTVNEDMLIETGNPASLGLFDYSEHEILGMPVDRLLPGISNLFADPNEAQSHLLSTRSTHGDFIYARKSNGNLFPVAVTLGEPITGEKTTWILIVTDMTERVKTEQGLRLMARVFEDSYDAIVITDIDGNIIDVNGSFLKITGYSREQVFGKNPRIMKSGRHDEAFYRCMWQSINESGRWCGEIWDRKKNGDVYPKWLSISAVKNDKGQVSNYVGIFTDITSRIEVENKLRQLAHYDTLTGLPNRTLFMDRLAWVLDLSIRNRQRSALLFLDLDRFKIINDTLGHQAGDELLIEIAGRLKKSVRNVDVVARLAGDEFTIILMDVKDANNVVDVAEKILESLSHPINLQRREIYVTISVGITLMPTDGNTVEKLLKNADTAMYHAKSLGKNQFQFYSGYMNRIVQEELEIETNLRKALEKGEFLLYYQPQIELGTESVMGVEVLIRWKHPALGFIPPDRFIPFAEKTHLIAPIGNWVVREACEQFMKWRRQGIVLRQISVNYSGRQLKQPGQVEAIAAVLAETGMDPGCLEIELTESVLMEDVEDTIRKLGQLKHMGLSISVDDFGTGYSSLSYLKRFPIDTLKIDKSFIDDIATNPDDDAIASTIIAMAHSLRLSVVAEGVETHEQVSILQSKKCDAVQGYWFCPPVPAEEVIGFITSLNSISPV